MTWGSSSGNSPDNVTLGLNGSNNLEVKALGVSTAKIAAGAVTPAKIDSTLTPGIVIASGTLASAAASIDLTSIPTGYRKLELILTTTGSADAMFFNGKFNGDAGTNYVNVAITSNNSSAPTGLANTTGAILQTINFANNNLGYIFLEIYNTTASLVKHYHATIYNGTNFSKQTGYWNNTANEINQVTLTPWTGNIVAGTKYLLIGYK